MNKDTYLSNSIKLIEMLGGDAKQKGKTNWIRSIMYNVALNGGLPDLSKEKSKEGVQKVLSMASYLEKAVPASPSAQGNDVVAYISRELNGETTPELVETEIDLEQL